MRESTADELEIRAATRADIGVISRIMNYPPEPPMAAMLGASRAGRLGDIFVRAGISLKLHHSVVAVLNGAVAGVMECGGRTGPATNASSYLRLLPRVLPALGPVTPRAVYGFWLRRRLQFDPVPDAFAIGELYVDEAMRNRGIGGRLLEHADGIARGNWSRMCIETGVTNPARRLYERHGFKVIETKTDAAYERLTGSPGRILMTKGI